MSVNARRQLEDGPGGVFLSLGAPLYQFTQNRWRRPFRVLFMGSQMFVPYTLMNYPVHSQNDRQKTCNYAASVLNHSDRRCHVAIIKRLI